MPENRQKAVWAIGLMSGTSMDGIDAALILTDGTHVFEHGPAFSMPYTDEFRNHFSEYLGETVVPDILVEEFTHLNVNAVQMLLAKAEQSVSDVAVVGFHGQTLFHDPAQKKTVQIGDGQMLSNLTGIDTVFDFRTADVLAGGQGAPFAPLYHQALALDLEGPLVVLNLGGVGNVTYINGKEILAFDTGPASAMIDDWVRHHTDLAYDEGGQLAASGKIDEAVLAGLLDNGYFLETPPKSLDRDDFSADAIQHLSLEDGAATLTAFTIRSVASALAHFPDKPVRWLVTGGGRKNTTMMRWIADAVQALVQPVEDVGWRGDELEAEAFAFLAVRSCQHLPLSLPTTTGVPEPLTGGVFCASKRAS